MATASPPRQSDVVDHPIIEKLTSARRTVINRVRLRGTLWGLVSLVSIWLAMSLLDYILRQDDAGTRWFLSVCIYGAIGSAIAWLVLPAWRWQPTLSQIAKRIETFFPDLKDKVSSALFFLQQSEEDARGSSSYMRRRHVNLVSDTLSYTDLSVALNRNLTHRSMYGLGLVVLLLIWLGIFAPQFVTIATSRLAMPWESISWPRTNRLAMVDPPSVVSQGARAVFYVEDQNLQLPEYVELQVRKQDEPTVSTFPMQHDVGSQQMVYQLEAVQQDFEYRAIGGDDETMVWRSVQVVKPPKFNELSLTVIPPDYTHWEPADSPRSIIALAGSKLQLVGRVDQPINAAELVFEIGTETNRFPLNVGPDQLAFSTPQDLDQLPTLSDDGRYWIEVTVISGLKKSEPTRHPIRIVQDKAPFIRWEVPKSNLTMTAVGQLDIQAEVRDDLAIRGARLVVRPSGSEQPMHTQSLYQRRGELPSQETPSNLTSGGADQELVETTLELDQLSDLEPGVVLELTIEAIDFRPQTGISLPRVITIISSEQLDRRINREQREIITKISDARRQQQDARQQTRSVELKMEEGADLLPADLANLQNGAQNQKSVRDKLTGSRDSAKSKIEALLDELRQNGMQGEESSQMLQGLLDNLKTLTEEKLVPVESEMSDLRRSLNPSKEETQESSDSENKENLPGSDEPASSAQQDEPDSQEQEFEQDPQNQDQPGSPQDRSVTNPSQLAKVGKQQEQIARQLQDWQNELTKWDTFRRFTLDVRDVAERQGKLSEKVKQEAGETLGKDKQEMTPQQRASLKQMAEEQSELASELDRIQQRMRGMKETNPESEEVANTLEDAIAENRNSALSQRMRQAGKKIDNNQLADARDAQERISQSLDDVLDTLQGRRESNRKELLRKLKRTENEIQELQRQQKQLEQKSKQLKTQQPDQANQNRELERLANQAKQLQKDAERLARKLERLGAKKAAEKLRNAASRLEDVSRNAENLSPPQLEEEIKKAQKDLEEAEKELQKQQEQVEQDLAEEQGAKLKQSIDQMVQRQQRIKDDLARLSEINNRLGKLTPAQQRTLSNLSLGQATLAEEIRAFAEAIAKAEVFHLSLQLTAEVTTELARLLDAGQIDAATLDMADEAVQRLEQLQLALKEDEQDAQQSQAQQDQEQSQGENQGQGQSGNSQQDGISQTAQLRLLKSMQESLRDRTQALIEQSKTDPSQVDAARLARLAGEQGRLSEMTLNLVEATEEELFDIDQIPDLDLDPEQPEDTRDEETLDAVR